MEFICDMTVNTFHLHLGKQVAKKEAKMAINSFIDEIEFLDFFGAVLGTLQMDLPNLSKIHLQLF